MSPNQLLCFSCMRELDAPGLVCPHCGHDNRIRHNGPGMLGETVLGGQYQVGRLLGRGGFGITYMGYDLNLKRPVAIKEYYPSQLVTRDGSTHALSVLSDCQESYRKGRERALKESQMAAGVGQISGVVQVYNAFAANNTIYIIMEYVAGQTLTHYVEQAPAVPTPEQAEKLLAPVATALAQLHKMDVVHRDVKPDNIMIRSRDQKGVLLDFGAARVADDRTLSSSAAIVSAGYAPVEQYNLSSLDGRIDQYALAATLLHTLTGQRPPDVLQRIAQPESMPEIRTLNPAVSPAVEQAVLKGMSLRADDRYPDMEAFWNAFTGEDSAAGKSGSKTGSKTGSKRKSSNSSNHSSNTTGKVIAAAAGVALVGGMLCFAVPAIRQTAGPAATEAPIVTAAPAVTDEPTAAPTARPVPEACALTVTDEGIVVSIPAMSGCENILCYELYRKDRQENVEKIATLTPGGRLEATDTGLVSGQVYLYYYVIVCEDGSVFPNSDAAANVWLEPTAAVTAEPTVQVTATPTPTSTPTATPTATPTPKPTAAPTPKPTAAPDAAALNYNYTTLKDGTISITEYIGSDATVTVPEKIEGKKVTAIGAKAFKDHSELTGVTIPDGVTSIGSSAFAFCGSLTGITIPDNVTSIGNSVFYNCDALTDIVIPDGVTSIGSHAFYDCNALTAVSIPGSVISIGSHAFYGCNALTGVSIPGSITDISFYTFAGCSSLTSITIPDSVTSIGDSAFFSCSKLTSIYIPASVTSIGDYAFGGCYRLTITTPKGSYAEQYAKDNGINVDVAAEQPFSYTILKDGTLSITGYNGSDAKVVVPAEIYGMKVTAIGAKAFKDHSELTGVTIPDGVASIGDSAFAWCDSLTSITIPDGVTSIGNSAFMWCGGLTSITIPDSVTSIGESVFDNCSSLTSITIPDSVTSIGDGAFCCCGLTSITIPASTTEISVTAFAQTGRLTKIKVNSENPAYISVDGVLFNKAQTELIHYPAGSSKKNYEIPDGVTSIGDYAFVNCYNLYGITLPDSVTTIGDYAFFACHGLTRISIPDGVTSIGDVAFSSCNNLTSITIPDGVTSIGNYVFNYCTGLTSITIPDSVTSIGNHAFSTCSSLTSITIPASVTSIDSSAFQNCPNLTITTPKGSYAEQYAKDNNLKYKNP